MKSVPPFDPARAAGPTLVVDSAEVLDLLPLTHATEKVTEYREAFLRGDRFPPLGVVRIFGRLVLADGHKRLTAYRSAGGGDVLVEVWTGGRWTRDQLRQARDHARKNVRIAGLLFSDPAEAFRHLRATGGHWRRVAASLLHLLGERLPGRR